MILGFTFAGFTPGFERHDFWSDEALARENIEAVRSLKTDPTILNNSIFGLPGNRDELFRVRRIYQNNASFLWAGVFQHAHSMHRTRSGTYMSVGVWFVNSTLLGNDLLKLLRDLASILSETSLRDGEFYRPLADSVSIEDERLRSMMQRARETLKITAAASTENFIEGAEVFDFTAARRGELESLQSFFASCLLVAASQIRRRDVYFFFSDSVLDVLRNRGTKEIVNYSRLIDDEVTLLNAAEAKEMLQAGLNSTSLVPDNARPLDYPAPGSHGQLTDILYRLRQIEASFKEMRSSQREFSSLQREFNAEVWIKIKRLSFLCGSLCVVIFLMLLILGYALKLDAILPLKW